MSTFSSCFFLYSSASKVASLTLDHSSFCCANLARSIASLLLIWLMLFSTVVTSVLISDSLTSLRSDITLILSAFNSVSLSFFSATSFSSLTIIPSLSFITVFMSLISSSSVALLYLFDKRLGSIFFLYKSFAIASFSSNESSPSQRENNLPWSVCPMENKSPSVFAVADTIRSKSSREPIESRMILLVCCVLSASQFSINSNSLFTTL